MPAASLCAVALVTRSSDLRWKASDSALTLVRSCECQIQGQLSICEFYTSRLRALTRFPPLYDGYIYMPCAA